MLADINKLQPGDIIFAANGAKHKIETINKNSQGMINSITTETHHLAAFRDIYTKGPLRKV